MTTPARMTVWTFVQVICVLSTILQFTVAQGAVTPSGMVPVYCGKSLTFICKAANEPLKWKVTGLQGIDILGPFFPRLGEIMNVRIRSNDDGKHFQFGKSDITILRFSTADNGGTIQCINTNDSSVKGTATILIVKPFVPLDLAARNVPVLEEGTAIFNCKPKESNAVDRISWSLTSVEGVRTEINFNRTNVTGTSGSYLSPDKMQLLITGVQNSLNGTRVECGPANEVDANITSNCAETAYISVQNFTNVSPTLIRKIRLTSRLAVVLVWSVPGFVVDAIDGSVISIVMLTPNGPKAIRRVTVGRRVIAYAADFPERGASYQVTVRMTMNGLRSRPLTVEVNV